MKSRFVAPAVGTGHNPLTFPDGTTFSTAAGSTVDVDEAKYHDQLEAAGWIFVAAVGTTAERPTVASLPRMRGGGPHGFRYADTTLGAFVIYDASRGVWMNSSGAAV